VRVGRETPLGSAPEHVGQVAAPEGDDALLARHALEAVDDACVATVRVRARLSPVSAQRIRGGVLVSESPRAPAHAC
jgi:hypothetical protein